MTQFLQEPSQVLLQYLTKHRQKVQSLNHIDYILGLITSNQIITKDIADNLANIFENDSNYWLEIQKNWDLLKSEPLKPTFNEFDSLDKAFLSVKEEQVPSKVYIDYESDGFVPFYIIDEQAFNYFISKCNEDEKWDLGWLGKAEKFCKSVPLSPRFNNLLSKLKLK